MMMVLNLKMKNNKQKKLWNETSKIERFREFYNKESMSYGFFLFLKKLSKRKKKNG